MGAVPPPAPAPSAAPEKRPKAEAWVVGDDNGAPEPVAPRDNAAFKSRAEREAEAEREDEGEAGDGQQHDDANAGGEDDVHEVLEQFSEEELLASLERRRAAQGWKRRAWDRPASIGDLPALGTVVGHSENVDTETAADGNSTYVASSSAASSAAIPARATHSAPGSTDASAADAPQRRRWGREVPAEGRRFELVPVGTGAIDPSGPTVRESDDAEEGTTRAVASPARAAGDGMLAPVDETENDGEEDEGDEAEGEDTEIQDYVDMLASMKAVLTSRPRARAGTPPPPAAGSSDATGPIGQSKPTHAPPGMAGAVDLDRKESHEETGSIGSSTADDHDHNDEDDDDDDSFFEEEVGTDSGADTDDEQHDKPKPAAAAAQTPGKDASHQT